MWNTLHDATRQSSGNRCMIQLAKHVEHAAWFTSPIMWNSLHDATRQSCETRSMMQLVNHVELAVWCNLPIMWNSLHDSTRQSCETLCMMQLDRRNSKTQRHGNWLQNCNAMTHISLGRMCVAWAVEYWWSPQDPSRVNVSLLCRRLPVIWALESSSCITAKTRSVFF